MRPEAGTSGAVEATVRSLPASFSARTIAAVTYDEDLAARIRELVGGEETLTEQEMFGGLAFLIRGNMAVSASGQGGLMVRVDPAKSDELVATTPARPVEMRGRSTRGWLRVSTEDLCTKRELAKVGRAGHDVRAFTPSEAVGLPDWRRRRPRSRPIRAELWDWRVDVSAASDASLGLWTATGRTVLATLKVAPGSGRQPPDASCREASGVLQRPYS